MRDNNGVLRLKRLWQVGLVVRDIDKTVDFLETVFGVRDWVTFEPPIDYCIDRGCEAAVRLRIAVSFSGGVQFELIQVLEGRSIHLDHLEEQGEGLHHLGFVVKDLEASVRACENAGIDVMHRGALRFMGMKFEYAYMDTTGVGGIIIEFIKVTFLGINVPQAPGPLLLKAYSRLQRRFKR